jgi:hypothetical protein
MRPQRQGLGQRPLVKSVINTQRRRRARRRRRKIRVHVRRLTIVFRPRKQYVRLRRGFRNGGRQHHGHSRRNGFSGGGPDRCHPRLPPLDRLCTQTETSLHQGEIRAFMCVCVGYTSGGGGSVCVCVCERERKRRSPRAHPEGGHVEFVGPGAAVARNDTVAANLQVPVELLAVLRVGRAEEEEIVGPQHHIVALPLPNRPGLCD